MSRLKNCLVAATFLLAACGQATPGDGSADAKGVRATDKKLDVAGVTIGMSMAEATAVLSSGGWKVEQRKGDTWDAAVNNELARQNVQGRKTDYSYSGIGGLTATKGEETIFVEFNPAPPPVVGRVKKASYNAPAGSQTDAEIMAGFARRYGTPDVALMGGNGSPDEGTWCVGGRSCATGQGFGKRTWLKAGIGGIGRSVQITMEQGRDAYDAYQAQLRGAVGAALGSQGKPSY